LLWVMRKKRVCKNEWSEQKDKEIPS
jgi:hypothetical protein